MSLNARDRRYKVMFQRKVVAEDDYGGEEDYWQEVCTEWVDIVFGTGAERREAAQERASAPATFSALRNSATATLSTVDRIVYPMTDPDPEAWPVWDITSIVPSRKFNKGFDITAVSAAP